MATDATLVETHDTLVPDPPYRWEIYRGHDPVWVERAMHGYRTKDQALQDGRLALERLMNREMQTKGRSSEFGFGWCLRALTGQSLPNTNNLALHDTCRRLTWECHEHSIPELPCPVRSSGAAP